MLTKNKGFVFGVVAALAVLSLVVCAGCQSGSTASASPADVKSPNGVPAVKASPGVHNIGRNDH
ncbi:MAG: hypothetical protein H8F28_03175 [Fibrella sp.]|nr:hypothetical protein [Armatimonadota bacterium]